MKIRLATIDDVSTVWALTRDMAEYEQALDSYTVTEEFFRNVLSNKTSPVEWYLIEENGDVIGMGQIFTKLNTYAGRYAFNLEDFIIKEKFRGKGYGKKFLEFLAKLAHDRGHARIDWAVMTSNDAAMAFYKKFGAVDLHQTNFRMTEALIKILAISSQHTNKPEQKP